METAPIKQTDQKANWQSRLLNDLVFIKQHGRYPLSKKTLLPVTAIFVFLFFLVRLAWPVMFLARNTSFIPYIIAVVCLLGIVNLIMRYRNMLRFKKLATPYHVAENIRTLSQFFRIQQLAYTQPPEAPEVFMIMSRPLGGRDSNREVMLFIADDRKILVNSHFIDQRFTINPSSKQAAQMAAMLQNWLNKHINNSDSTVITHK